MYSGKISELGLKGGKGSGLVLEGIWTICKVGHAKILILTDAWPKVELRGMYCGPFCQSQSRLVRFKAKLEGETV